MAFDLFGVSCMCTLLNVMCLNEHIYFLSPASSLLYLCLSQLNSPSADSIPSVKTLKELPIILP